MRTTLFALLASAALVRAFEAGVGAAGSFGAPVGVEPAWIKRFSAPTGATEQYWINFGATPDAMAIRWCTNSTSTTTVQWGTASGSYPNTASGNSTRYTYGVYTSPVIHTVTITSLPLNTTIYYRVAAPGSASWGPEYSFRSNPGSGSSDAFFPSTVAFMADVGESNAAQDTINRVLGSADEVDSVVINGDISYATGCEKNGCTTWDAWGRLASPLAAIKPWGVSLGNHDADDNANGVVASSSEYRFAGQPTGGRSSGLQWFSWNAGPVHFVSVYCFYDGGFGASSPLTRWVAADLAAVDSTVTPWIIVTLHAPAYNSNSEHQGDGEPWRQGLEQLFISAGVSAVFGGHVHAYERSTPVNNNVVQRSSGPGSMTHLNIGDGGAGLYTSWRNPQPAWSAYRDASWGHGRWTALNLTHSIWRWYDNSDNAGVARDQATILNSNQKAWEIAAQRTAAGGAATQESGR